MGSKDDLTKDQLTMLKDAFDAFDTEKKGTITTEMVGTILEMIGPKLNQDELDEIIMEIDEDDTGVIDYDQFCDLAARFIVEEDVEAIQKELREAFRLYDREGNGYITIDVLREILIELDDTIPDDELDDMIDEMDADGSGTLDFEEFMAVMTGRRKKRKDFSLEKHQPTAMATRPTTVEWIKGVFVEEKQNINIQC